MRLLVLTLILFGGVCLRADYRSPIRDVCESPGVNSLTTAQTVGELAAACSSLAQNPSEKVQQLSSDVLNILAHMEQQDSWKSNSEVKTAVAELTDAYSDSLRGAAPLFKRNLRTRIKRLANDFRTVSARENKPDSYFRDIKKIIAETSQGERLLQCFENNPDSRIGRHEVSFLRRGARRAGNDESAHLDILKLEGDQRGRKKIVLELDLRTNPIAAIAMVAHEMQHACAVTEMCNHIDKCDEQNDCTDYNQTIIVDELIAHNLEAQVFAELADAAPALVCDYTYIDGRTRGPKRLSDLHAENQEEYENGTLLRSLTTRYINAGLWFSEDVRGSNGGFRPELISRIRAANIPEPPQD